MRNFKVWLGIMLILGAVFGAMYLGVWVMFIGGILDVVHEGAKIIAEQPYSSSAMGLGIAKILLASPVSVLAGWMVGMFGLTLATSR